MDDATREHHKNYGLGQQHAATEVHKVIASSEAVQQDASLAAVRETDIYRLRRGICLPSATATCINSALGRRVITEEPTDDILTLGTLFGLPFRYHNKIGLKNKEGVTYDKPWFAVDEQGNVYHQVSIALANGFDIEAMSVEGFSNLDEIVEFVKAGGKVALSLNNRFVLDHTLGNDPKLVKHENEEDLILIKTGEEEAFRRFEQGRHVVSILGIDSEGKLIVHDSFTLPQQGESHGIVMDLDKEVLEKYLAYSNGARPRAIVFTTDPQLLLPLSSYANTTFTPIELVNDVKRIAKTPSINA